MIFTEKIKNQIKDLFTGEAMTVDHDTALLNSNFNYYAAYKAFFTYMKESGYADYKTAHFLKNKINEFGDAFAVSYKNAVNADAEFKNALDIRHVNLDEQVSNLRLKFCGNLFEAISIIYFMTSNPLNGFSFAEWTNGGDDDANGCDGKLVMNDNKKIVIPINAKHITHQELSKFAPFQKLECWVKQREDKLWSSDRETVMTYFDLPFTGSIITDLVASNFTKEKFTKIKVINGNDLHKALGNYGAGNVTKCNIWTQVEKFL